MEETLIKLLGAAVKMVQEMTEYTQRGEARKAEEVYRKLKKILDPDSSQKLESSGIYDSLGNPDKASMVAKVASDVLNSYGKCIKKEIKDRYEREMKKDLERVERQLTKFEKLREKLEQI